MIIDNLFGPEGKKPRTLRLKVIKPIFESLKITEAASQYLNKKTPLSSSVLVADMFGFLRHETKEHFIALHLNRLLCLEIVSVGSINASIVHPREVYKSILLSAAAAAVFVHNHPSGDPTPSSEDIEITSRLKAASELLGIRLLDHVIVGDCRHYSFADSGLL